MEKCDRHDAWLKKQFNKGETLSWFDIIQLNRRDAAVKEAPIVETADE